jgi:hypothetical protein
MQTLPIGRPDAAEYASFYAAYVGLVPEEDILGVLEAQLNDAVALLRGTSEDQANTRHPPYTWSVKEVVGHVTDTERVFGYRALRFARGDSTPLPGFDENSFAKTAGCDSWPLAELLAEFEAVRRSNLWLLRHLDATAWRRSGVANNNPVSVRALAYIIAGHSRHHQAILRKRLSQS